MNERFNMNSEVDDLKMVERGRKRVAIIYNNTFISMRSHLPFMYSPDPTRVIVYGKGYKRIAEAVYKLINLPGTSKFKDPGYHRALGQLLDYDEAEIENFIKELKIK